MQSTQVNHTLALRAAVALAFAGAAMSAFAQQVPTAPPGGGILKELERSLPTRPTTSPDRARIEVPDAPALQAASAQARVTVSAYRVTGNTVFDEETLLAVIKDRTGEKIVADLHAAADALTAYYRDRGYLLARAYVPQQEVTAGTITIAVLEGRYDQIRGHNTARVSDERVLRTVKAPLCQANEDCTGSLISSTPLERGLLLLNDTPGVQAAARLSPGEFTGMSTLDVNAVEDSLASGYVQLDNGGSYYSGVARGVGTLWINSPTGIGDQITLQGVATSVHGNLYYGALGYGLPLGYDGARLNVRGSYLQYELGDRYESLDAHGTVTGGDATLFLPFVRSQAANFSGAIGYGKRRFHDEADAVGVETERRIADRTEIGLNGNLRDRLFGVTALNTLALTFVRGDLELDEALSFADAFTARAEGGYTKWMASYSRAQRLFGLSSLHVRAAVQGTADNLDSYEKFALGGSDAVRAYPASDTLVDEAELYSIEWRQRFPISSLRALEAVLFYDRARGDFNASPWGGNARNRVKMSGAGIGLNCALSDSMTLSSTLAWRGDRPMTAAPDSTYQYNLSLNMAF
jgi:hemolysin activation/secretion protein